MTDTNYMIHESAYADEGAIIGKGTKIWHFSHLMSGCILGENCNIGQNVFIASGAVLGKNVKVQNNVSIYEGILCEDDVFLGPSAVFTNVINPRSAVNRRGQYHRTTLRKGVTIGANATIVCGIEIGRFAFVGAGAVITKDIGDYELWVGNPARRIGWMSSQGYRLIFDREGSASCPGNGDKYILKGGQVYPVTS